jgi:hypothetical protein
MSEGEITVEEVAWRGPAAAEELGPTVAEEAEVRPVPYDPAAVAASAPTPSPDFRAGTAALAAMPDEKFEVRLVAMRQGRERITRIHRELMDPEMDYGVIPGTKQPTLLKSGAEKLCEFYRLAAEFNPQISYGDGVTTPPVAVVTECRLHLGTLDGPVVNTGFGAANSWESRYRYRRGECACPACGKTGGSRRKGPSSMPPSAPPPPAASTARTWRRGSAGLHRPCPR